ncbi:MAG: hypothetical protein N2049_03570 [Anaerolineales bacterium]|nr:hypothetical protein [Anaerolineales bacterium]MCX7608283.1 hypothetical protein [Anaerolineales bacterium]MDW8227442.1 hypothetical protein [Anaerolineales bacterium]
MLDKFWESLGGDLAGEWLRRAFSPPFLFYLSGLGFYLLRHGWQPLWAQLLSLSPVEQVTLLVLLLVGLILSALLSAQWRFSLLRWMEGYWPWPLRYLEGFWIARQARHLEKAEKRLNAIPEQASPTLTRQRAALEVFIHYFPADPSEIRPTRLGNILRAGETAPMQKYGLDAYVCWPRLWPLLPGHLRDDLSAVRNRLLTLAELWGMGLLSLIWVIWSWWALPLALLWMWIASQLAFSAAMVYADLIESAFDLYRFSLYDALGWPRPAGSEDETAYGQTLTEFLWRGTLERPVRYRNH